MFIYFHEDRNTYVQLSMYINLSINTFVLKFEVTSNYYFAEVIVDRYREIPTDKIFF